MVKQAIGLLGGTFDPVHWGHLAIALHCQQALKLAEVRLIPCQQPVHKAAALANAAHRLAMLRLAIDPYPQLQIDERELQRTTPSYMIDTLKSLRQELPDTPLALIMGYDAFNGLEQWHNWHALIDLAHFILVPRPGYALSTRPALTTLLNQHLLKQPSDLHRHLAGGIWIEPMPEIAAASTTLRLAFQKNAGEIAWVPAEVLAYLKQHRLYQTNER